jgi:hypothetical protein
MSPWWTHLTEGVLALHGLHDLTSMWRHSGRLTRDVWVFFTLASVVRLLPLLHLLLLDVRPGLAEALYRLSLMTYAVEMELLKAHSPRCAMRMLALLLLMLVVPRARDDAA